jgi:type IV pilus assembly protein PilC
MTVSGTKITEKPDSSKQKQGKHKSTFSGEHLQNTTNRSLGRMQKEHIADLSQVRGQRLHLAKVKRAELILFTTQLAVMLDSGVVLSDALDAIAEQSEYSAFKMIIMDVSEAIKSGENFSKALANYPKVFNPMFISMVKASEASGKMVEMLRVLSGYLTFEVETRKHIKGALTYPIIMAIMAVVATGTLMFFVLPRFMKIYESRGAALPKITQMLVVLSQTLGDFQVMTTVLTTLIPASMALYYWSGTVSGQRVIDYVKIHTPVLGTMFIDMVVTRSMRIMSTMINTGVSLLGAIEVMQGSCENYYFQQLWAVADRKIRDGYQLSESIQICQSGERASFNETNQKLGAQLIAPGVIQMLRAGEKSGKLGEVCDKISTFYEKKLEASIKSVMALIEPLMITILGAIIGTIAIALLLPVFRISTVIAH